MREDRIFATATIALLDDGGRKKPLKGGFSNELIKLCVSGVKFICLVS